MKDQTLDSGVLLINKPKDISSFGVVSRVRKMLGQKKVGHLGTLDPFAVGLLPIVFGRGTRLTQYLMDHDKVYRVQVVLGIATDTMDRQGAVVVKLPLSEERILELLEHDSQIIRFAVGSLVGVQEQKPPMYSAVKVEGKPLYYYARRGEEIARASREIEVYRAELLGVKQGYSLHSPEDKILDLDIIIHCSKGTYIRVLADELGRRLDSAAHASELERVKVGSLSNEQAITLTEAESLFYDDCGQDSKRWVNTVRQLGHVLDLEQAASDFPAQNLDDAQALKIASGMAISASETLAGLDGRQSRLLGGQPAYIDSADFIQNESASAFARSTVSNSLQKNIICLLWRGRLIALARLTEDDKFQPETVFVTREELLRERGNEDS